MHYRHHEPDNSSLKKRPMKKEAPGRRTGYSRRNKQQRRRSENIALLARIAKITTTYTRSLPSYYRPLVGIPMNANVGLFAKWPLQAVDARVVQAVVDAGGTPVPFMCRPITAREHPFLALWHQISQFDALVLPGGPGDVDPRWYSDNRHPQTMSNPLQWEDWWIAHCATLATLLRVPFLGICLGMQYWNVALGGTLYQDLRTEYRGGLQHIVRGKIAMDSFIPNTLSISPIESIIATCAENASEITGPCLHHQGINKVAPDLVVTACTLDGLPEVIERIDAFGIGVQFHPEASTQRYARNLFARMMEEGRQYAASDRDALTNLQAEIGQYLYNSSPYPRLVLPSPAPGKLSNMDQAHLEISRISASAKMFSRDGSHILGTRKLEEEVHDILSRANHAQ